MTPTGQHGCLYFLRIPMEFLVAFTDSTEKVVDPEQSLKAYTARLQGRDDTGVAVNGHIGA